MTDTPEPAWWTQVASDVERDGLGLELYDDADRIRAEVFRSDSDHTVVVTIFGGVLAAPTHEWLLQRAVQELNPFEDGTALPAPDKWRHTAA